uniref:NADH dehydrogenase [ubiquinone] flavoprotein 3, mitochondrial n=1 Tax=Panagrolaimus superbus TaxID=310955 RepID=A0A914XYR2_9BILA
MLSARHSIAIVTRLASTTVPSTGTTGIEHAIKFKEIGKRHKQDFKDYKCIDYLNYNIFSYYDIENDMKKYRVAQPSKDTPDTLPSIKQ